MRESGWVRALVCGAALAACNAERPVEGEHDPIAVSEAALAAPFDPLACTLGAECRRWGELIAEPAGTASECAPLTGDVLPLAWHALTGGQVPCSFGTCRLLDAQLAVEADGRVLTLSRIELPSTLVRAREAGLWLARYGADGAALGAAPWNASIPPPGIEVQNHALLLSAPGGGALLASARALLPADAPRPLTLAPIAGRQQPAVKPARVSTPPSRAERVALGADGALLVSAAQRLSSVPIANEDRDWGGSFNPTHPQRAALTSHDRHGRVLWNRPWPADGPNTAIHAVHVDATGRITVRSAADRGALHGNTITRLDRAGRVLWQRIVAPPRYEQLQSAVDAHGNVYVLLTGWDDDFTVFSATVERLDASGHRTGLWSISNVGFMAELQAAQGRVWLTSRVDFGTGMELWVMPFAGDTTACNGQRHGFEGDWMDFFDGQLVLATDGSSGTYIANSRMIARLGGTP